MTDDIGVCMRDEVFEHGLRDGRSSDGAYCYWTFSRGIPKGVDVDSRLWVANRGRWAGYFEIFSVDDDELLFYSESFIKVDGGPRKPFMGFTRHVPQRGN